MDQMKMKQTLKRMTAARAYLLRDTPFFGHLSLGLAPACAPCGTACTDGNRLIFDPDFAEQLSDREMQFIVLHEVLHCVLNHCSRGKGLHSLTYNVACDIVVNSTILEMWGMDEIKIAGEEAMHLAPDGKEGRLYNAEEIYHMLMSKKNDNDGGNVPLNCVSGGVANGPSGGKSNGFSGDKNGDDASDGSNGEADSKSSDKSNNKSSGKTSVARERMSHEMLDNMESGGSQFDRHDLWQGICDKNQLADSWKGKIVEAIKSCGDSTGMPQNMRDIVYSLEKRTGLDWKQLLHDFIQHDLYDYSFLPPDRRYSAEDFYLPAYNVDEENGSVHDIWVCVDTSASISDDELECAMAEILDAIRQAGLGGLISFFDSNITEPVPFETQTELKKIKPSGGGGTSFKIIFKYMQMYMAGELPRAILVFTDGYAPWPKESEALGVPVLWLISKNGWDEVPWGRVAKL